MTEGTEPQTLGKLQEGLRMGRRQAGKQEELELEYGLGALSCSPDLGLGQHISGARPARGQR